MIVVQLLSSVQFFVTSWSAACQSPLSPTVSWRLLKFMCMESVMLSNHLILHHPLLLLPSIFPSSRVFSELALHVGGQKYWSFSISPSNEYSGLTFFRIHRFDLAVQGKRLLQHRNWKTSILWHSAFFMVQLSHPSMTTGKTKGLTLQTVTKVMSLLFKTESRFVTAFLLRSNYLLISWLSSPSAVFLQPRKIKSITTSTFFPIYLP